VLGVISPRVISPRGRPRGPQALHARPCHAGRKSRLPDRSTHGAARTSKGACASACSHNTWTLCLSRVESTFLLSCSAPTRHPPPEKHVRCRDGAAQAHSNPRKAGGRNAWWLVPGMTQGPGGTLGLLLLPGPHRPQAASGSTVASRAATASVVRRERGGRGGLRARLGAGLMLAPPTTQLPPSQLPAHAQRMKEKTRPCETRRRMPTVRD